MKESLFNFDFKIAVFDLDLTLWNSEDLYPDVLSILQMLKQCNIPLYIASFHKEALQCCDDLNISNYFDNIYYGRHMNKLQMINEIKKQHVDIQDHEIVFFDDNPHNIQHVQKNSNIKSILVNEGLSWGYIPIKCSMQFFM